MTLRDCNSGDPPSTGLDPSLSSHLPPNTSTAICTKCQLPIEGDVVHALGGIFHEHCFTCPDCNKPVASRFFPMDLPNGSQQPFCEQDYFNRLNRVCDKCGEVLTGSYLTAGNKNFHLNHFCCCVCSVVLGPDDSYYENDNNIYCLYHHSLQFAIKCTGCQTPILKQFVEIPKNDSHEHWHPECHMINKFWNVKLAQSLAYHDHDLAAMTPEQFTELQAATEEKIYRIWTVLSAFEESATACISDMLVHVSAGAYLESVRMTDYFITHVEVLFAALDDLLAHCKRVSNIELQHQRKAKQLCTTILNFLSFLALTQESGSRRMGVTESLMSLVTGVARCLKALIRVGLETALALEIAPDGTPNMANQFLSQLLELANKDRYLPQGADMLTASDLCQQCKAPCDDQCFRLGHRLWHDDCFMCNACSQALCNQHNDAFYDTKKSRLLCKKCAVSVSDATQGFVRVTQLQQFSFQLRLSLQKLYSLLNEPATGQSGHSGPTGTIAGPGKAFGDSISKPSADGEKPKKTINLADIKRMKSTHAKRTGTDPHRVAKRSTLMETPSPNAASVGTKQNVLEYHRAEQKAKASNADEDLQDEHADNLADALMMGDLSSLKHKKQDWDDMAASAEGAAEKPAGKPHYLAELSALDTFMVKHFAVLSLEKIVKDYFTLEELADLIDDKPPKIWTKFVNNLIAGNKKPVKQGTFGVPLPTLVEKNGALSSHGLSPSRVRIPAFIDDCITALDQMDLSVEGIFRKNGNIKRLKELSEEIDRNPNGTNLAAESPIQVAALTKKFLRELPDPLLTFRLYKLFTVIQKLSSPALQKRALHLTFCLLPKPNRDTAEVLFVFMRRVASFSRLENNTGSKMDLTNLATVLAPNILYSKSKDLAKHESIASIEVVQLLMEYNHEFCTVPEDIWDLLTKSSNDSVDMDADVHQVLRKCEMLMKAKKSSNNNGMPATLPRQHSSPAAVPTLASTKDTVAAPPHAPSSPIDMNTGFRNNRSDHPPAIPTSTSLPTH